MEFIPKLIWKEAYNYYSDKSVDELKTDIQQLLDKTRGWDFSVNLTGKFTSEFEFEMTPKWQFAIIRGFEQKISYLEGQIFVDEFKRTRVTFSVWNFETLMYNDFWTFTGFLRNTFYNGWNSIFPWIAFFFLGMYLGRLDWKDSKTPKLVLIIGISVCLIIYLIQSFATSITQDKDLVFYLTADYIPPFLPFMLGTASFGLILISVFIFIGNSVGETKIAKILASTGQMTLTHYVAHLVLGLIFLSIITGKTLSFNLLKEIPTNPMIILTFAITYFLLSCTFSYLWSKKYKNGPLEMLMRKISDGQKNSR